jgi:hypothetical protein
MRRDPAVRDSHLTDVLRDFPSLPSQNAAITELQIRHSLFHAPFLWLAHTSRTISWPYARCMGAVEVKLHSLYTALDRGKWSASRTARRQLWRWVSPRAGVEALEQRSSTSLCRSSAPYSLVTIVTELTRLLNSGSVSQTRSQNCEKRLSAFSCPSVRSE